MICWLEACLILAWGNLFAFEGIGGLYLQAFAFNGLIHALGEKLATHRWVYHRFLKHVAIMHCWDCTQTFVRHFARWTDRSVNKLIAKDKQDLLTGLLACKLYNPVAVWLRLAKSEGILPDLYLMPFWANRGIFCIGVPCHLSEEIELSWIFVLIVVEWLNLVQEAIADINWLYIVNLEAVKG